MVKMIATDTLHLSEIGPRPLSGGDPFEVSEDTAKQLETRGLAEREKAQGAAPSNKAEGRSRATKAAQGAVTK